MSKKKKRKLFIFYVFDGFSKPPLMYIASKNSLKKFEKKAIKLTK